MDKKVVELFAGVGGFRIGLNNITKFGENGKAIEQGSFEFVWANQWEPSTKIQHAADCYKLRFGDVVNEDISTIDKKTIPDHSLICGGFPCQDYSVAHSLSKAKGIEGKKGVLWWQINEILKTKKTPFVLLENVDRLLKSPAKQRGRDFGIMLKCFDMLGYTVEWRVINASDYGFPQRRKRTYIFAYKNSTKYGKKQLKKKAIDLIDVDGFFAKSFPIVKNEKAKECDISKFNDLVKFSDTFVFEFENSGIMVNGMIYTSKTTPIYIEPVTLGQIVVNDAKEEHYLTEEEVKKFEYLRGSKKIPRVDVNGFEYMYSEGAMSSFDDLNLPGRTMLTSEGTINRSTHIIKDPITNRLRLLTPIECERLNQFPEDWTKSGMPNKRRYFMMGNALVCGIVKKLGKEISEIIDAE
jgi:DNA (cytosine-5)-methyltransferase 1